MAVASVEVVDEPGCLLGSELGENLVLAAVPMPGVALFSLRTLRAMCARKCSIVYEALYVARIGLLTVLLIEASVIH